MKHTLKQNVLEFANTLNENFRFQSTALPRNALQMLQRCFNNIRTMYF